MPENALLAESVGVVQHLPGVVAIACNQADGVQLARTFGVAGAVPMLAFDADQFLRCIRSGAGVAVVEPHVTGTEALVVAANECRTSLLVVAERDRLDPDVRNVAREVVGPWAGAPEIVQHAHTLMEHRRALFAAPTLTWGPLTIDLGRRHAIYRGERVSLTPLQLRILAALAEAQGQVLSREQLQRVIWPGEPLDDGRRLDAHVHRIRARIGDDQDTPGFVLTVRSEGFRLADIEEALVGA
jgi:DNA-binding winged helix-turn-helix (wHTH) protein